MPSQNRFVDNGNGTVTDTQTGLMWKQTDTMNDLKKWINYQDSVDYVRELRDQKFAGYEDWRLPTQVEMQTVYDKSFSNKDLYDKEIHISEQFASGGGFSMICQSVAGRMRTWVLNIRDGSLNSPEGSGNIGAVWTISEATRAVRVQKPHDIAGS